MNLSYTPKFHMLHDHVPDVLFKMNGILHIGEEAIERWHEIRMRHHSRIRALRSDKKNEFSSEL